MSDAERPARDVGADTSTVCLRVDRATDDSEEYTHRLYCTDTEGAQLRVTVHEGLAGGLEPDAWYRFDGVERSRTPGAELSVPADTGTVERVETPARGSHPPAAELDDPWLVQLGASADTLAVTLQPRPTAPAGVRADDPETFEAGAVCLARGTTAEATVYHREEPGVEDEHLLLEHVVEDLSAAGETTLVTGSDTVTMLRGRLELAAAGDVLDAGAERVLDGRFHADLTRLAARGGDTAAGVSPEAGIESSPPSLDEYDIGLDPTDWRDDANGTDTRMSDRDYAALLERYLADDPAVDPAELNACLEAYASASLPVLRDLGTAESAAALGCPRLDGRR